MTEEITALLERMGIEVNLNLGRQMREIAEVRAQADRKEMAILVVLAIISVTNALLYFLGSIEAWSFAVVCVVVVLAFIRFETGFTKSRTFRKSQREGVERAIGNRIAIALAVVKIGDGESFILVTRVAGKDPDHGAYDFEYRLLSLQAVLLVLQDIFNEEKASSRFVVVYLLEMQAASLETFKDGPAGLLVEEMASALDTKPVAVAYP